jgi:hypothetical protein
VDRFNRFLVDLFIIRNLRKAAQEWGRRIQTRLKQIKPFSWETALLLSLLSWSVYALLQGYYAKKLVSVFAWGFLIIGVDWALLGQKIRIPLVGFQFQPGPWLTGAIACWAFFSNDLLIHDFRSALISWPIFSAVFASYPRFIQTGLRWQIPDSSGRQDLVLIFLVAGLLSAWFQFHFLIQDLLVAYPNLRADPCAFQSSWFVTQINPVQKRPTSQGYFVLLAVEQAIRQDLSGKNWIEVQRWLRNIETVQPDLSRRALDAVYHSQPSREKQLWQITASTAPNPLNIDLFLRAHWLGATSFENGYTLNRVCKVQASTTSPPQTLNDLQTQQTYQFNCDWGPVEGSIGVNCQRQP